MQPVSILNTSNESTNCGSNIYLYYKNNQPFTILPTNEYLTAGEINGFFKILSSSNIARMKYFIGELSDTENYLFKLSHVYSPYYVHRTTITRLENIIRSGCMLFSYDLANEMCVVDEPSYTPDLEDDLYGARDCVFVSAGPPYGTERYGEVAIILDEEFVESAAWATTSSGWYFLKSRYTGETADISNLQPGQDDIAIYSATVFSGGDFRDYMAYYLIGKLREMEKGGTSRVYGMIDDLLTATSREEFQNIISNEKLGYLEVKVPREIPPEAVKVILVPKEYEWAVDEWNPDSALDAKIEYY